MYKFAWAWHIEIEMVTAFKFNEREIKCGYQITIQDNEGFLVIDQWQKTKKKMYEICANEIAMQKNKETILHMVNMPPHHHHHHFISAIVNIKFSILPILI